MLGVTLRSVSGNEEVIYKTENTTLLSRNTKSADDVLDVDVIVDNDFGNSDEISNWAKDTIDNYINEKYQTFDIKRKIKFNSSTTETMGGCWDDWTPEVVPTSPLDNKIRVYITKDPKATFSYDEPGSYSSGWERSKDNVICIGSLNDNFTLTHKVILLHEFGHVFGLPDYYLQDVYANNNFVPIEILSSVKDVMWKDEPVYHPNSREIVNNITTNPLVGTVWNWQFYTPKQVILQILDNGGLPLPNVKVEVFPALMVRFKSGGDPVNYIPEILSFESITDATGRAYLGDQENIFFHRNYLDFTSKIPDQVAVFIKRINIGNATALIRITSQSEVRYATLTLSDLNTLYFAEGQTNFATIRLPFSQLIQISKGDNVKRVEGLYKLSSTPELSDDIRKQLSRRLYFQLKVNGELN